MNSKKFSSPQRGSFLSTINIISNQEYNEMFSSPQRGSFLSTNSNRYNNILQNSFRPLNGVLFYLHWKKSLYLHVKVFVPSTGFFSIYPASRSPLNLVVSRRVCGGNRIHLRNLSKKYIFSSKSFILWAAGQNIVLNWSVCHISHTHIIQFSLVFCTLTYVRCYFQANILCMFMRSI